MSQTIAENVPMLDLKSEVAGLYDELRAATDRVLRSGVFIGGPEVAAFEQETADFIGVRHAIGLNSGTDALVIGLEALGVGPGDEVITTAFSFFATSEAILRVGARPVFCDIDPVTLNMDPAGVEALVTERTKALLPVHVFGLPARLQELTALAERHDLAILEDCAQAFGARAGAEGGTRGSHTGGARVGSIGALGAFSFYPTKNLGAYGDGGMLTTNDDDLATLVRSLRNHGSKPGDKYTHDRLGHNSRLDAMQAAILRVKLPLVDAWNERRAAVAASYRAAFARSGVRHVTPPPVHPEHVYHQFTVQVPADRRPAYERALTAAGVEFSRFYPSSLTSQPVGTSFGSAPHADAVTSRVLSLPIRPDLSEAAVGRVSDTLAAAERG
ncbi:MAG TPA: DegT/DnrJ/EryC1/StrS family aminotransferase [Trueperaceae bacterium]|nr:DegT/DnrJ/EryC1/StrS family aminotransferase [Trueperaceae bacterium]